MEQALNAYEPILDKYIAKGESNNHYEEYYFLHDVTGDGIPELWLHVDGGESYNLLTFTYKDGQTKQISTILVSRVLLQMTPKRLFVNISGMALMLKKGHPRGCPC